MNFGFVALCLGTVGLAAERPSLSLPDLNGNVQSVEQYRGRVVIVNFWATWCIPCRAEMPLLVDLQKSYASRGVAVVGVSADDETTKAQIKPFVEELAIPFPIWVGASTAHMEQFGLGTALPATAILDQRGDIAFRIIGILERKAVTQRLDFLLSGTHGKAPERLLDTLSKAEQEHEHEAKEEHAHGGIGVEGASMVPS